MLRSLLWLSGRLLGLRQASSNWWWRWQWRVYLYGLHITLLLRRILLPGCRYRLPLVYENLAGVGEWGLRYCPVGCYGSLRTCWSGTKADCSRSKGWGSALTFHGTCRPDAKAVYYASSGGIRGRPLGVWCVSDIPLNLSSIISSTSEDWRPCLYSVILLYMIFVQLCEH